MKTPSMNLVDDFFIIINNIKDTTYMKKELSSKFEMKHLGIVKECLERHVDKESSTISLNQKN